MNIRRKHMNPEGLTRNNNPSRGYKGSGEEKVWNLYPGTAGLPNARELKVRAKI
jgi:hypothetical protein